MDMNGVFKVTSESSPHREVIKVVGVGGGGGNALNNIIRSGVTGVEFLAVNTDMASLSLSEAPTRLILGKELTKGHGAGADPQIGHGAAKESFDELKEVLVGADMVFLTAGMGGGTGTGASPVIAEIARETGSLVVAVVTTPFFWEGKRRKSQADMGIKALQEKVDALIVIENDKLMEISDKNTVLTDAFRMADDVLRQAVQGVTDLILRPALVNVDFADVRSVMQNAGSAIMGIGEGRGDNRAVMAAQAAINSPLMSIPMTGAKGVLFNITGGADVGIFEIHEAAGIINEASDDDANIIWGSAIDEEMEDRIKITVIATGFSDYEQAKSKATPFGKINTGSGSKSTTQRKEKKTSGIKLEPTDLSPDEDGPDMFELPGLPKDSYDVPSYIRKVRRTRDKDKDNGGR
ncbi:MAG: cell division protein FtsZ [Synergistota bacterium]|jgi:cell division protein FtsZ|nr:cell division protein FtsZ [Synergistota bacterium]